MWLQQWILISKLITRVPVVKERIINVALIKKEVCALLKQQLQKILMTLTLNKQAKVILPK